MTELNSLQGMISSSLRKAVIPELHEAHAGIFRMKSIAQIHVWLPTIYQKLIVAFVNASTANHSKKILPEL